MWGGVDGDWRDSRPSSSTPLGPDRYDQCPLMTRDYARSVTWQDPEAVRFMLDDCKVWAVVGLSGDTRRTAFSIAALLQERGKQIVPIHPSAASEGGLTVLGEKGYPTLADVPFPADVVDVFRRSEFAGEFADQAVAIGARAVWFQLGVIDADAFDRTVGAGVQMVMDTCPAIEWRRR